MALIRGKDTVERLEKQYGVMLEELGEMQPNLAIMRVGDKADDIAYENGAVKRMEKYGIASRRVTLPAGASTKETVEALKKLNEDKTVHGILILQPLPKQIDSQEVILNIAPEKDIEGLSPANVSDLFYDQGKGFVPCTAEAVMQMIETMEIDLKGKKVVIIGRSQVVGKPLALLMIAKQATVTVCNSKTPDMPSVTKQADIVVVAAGVPKLLDASYITENTIVIDVGTNVDENGKLCGDVDFDSVEPVAKAVTPVPGGVGGVTTCVLAGHIIKAAMNQR